jgi:hypothetical protein
MQLTPDQLQAQSNKRLTPKETEKLAQASVFKSQKVNPQQMRNMKLVANQAQSKPAIVRRNSPNQG